MELVASYDQTAWHDDRPSDQEVKLCAYLCYDRLEASVSTKENALTSKRQSERAKQSTKRREDQMAHTKIG
jgi:hypothetical protein